MKLRFKAFVLGTCISIASCGSQDLDRPLAEKLLIGNERLSGLQSKVALRSDANIIGQKLHWWKDLSRFISGQSIEGSISSELTKFHFIDNPRVEVATPVEIDVEVTGILNSKNENSAMVEFMWRYKNIGQKIAYLAIEGGSGKAIFQKYDDGWRILDFIEFKYNNNPYALTKSQLLELETEIANQEAQEKITKATEARAREERIAKARQLIIGKWDSRVGAMGSIIRYNADGSYQTFYRERSQGDVHATGNWNIEGNQLTMAQTARDFGSGQLQLDVLPPSTSTITDITQDTYTVEEFAIFLGGIKGSLIWRATRMDQVNNSGTRMAGQASASGGPEARGSAQQSSGPSSSYGSRVAARIRPNIRYTEDFPRSLRTEIEVSATADGTITGRRVVDSSGNAAWDDAALKAIDRTGSLPRDVDGRVPSPIIVVVRPTE